MFDFEFYSPWFLLLFLLFIPLLLKDFKKHKCSILLPSIQDIKDSNYVKVVFLLLKFLKYIILSCLILAMARPRSFTLNQENDETQGMDIVLSIDISLSMLAKDFDPDRISALKKIAQNFVNQRNNDRIGLVEYSGEAFMKVPLTFDHEVLKNEIEMINPNDTGLISGTNIGEGLAVAVNHLRKSKAKSKIIILMTDGDNTIDDAISPQVAASLAANHGIKVYTIGIGSNGLALMPSKIDVFGDIIFEQKEVKIDELTLSDIAKMTNGKYFRADSDFSLKNIYQEINRLEKTSIKSSKYYNYHEYFEIFLWIALIFLIFDALLRWVFFKKIN